jgi:hypothetical protein
MSTIDIRDNFTPKVLAHTYGKESRRPRLVPISTGKRIDISAADLEYTEPLAIHGPLTMDFIIRLIQSKRGIERHKQRGKELFHEDNTFIEGEPWGHRFLSRPLGQKRLIDIRTDDVIYGLTDATKKLLERRGRPYLVQPSQFDHQHMGACCTASIAIEARAAFKNHFETIGNRPLSFDVADAKLEPDALISLTYQERVIYFVEVDRSTEPLHSDNERKTIEGMFNKYINFIGKRWYKTTLNTGDMARLLFITNSKGRMESVMDFLYELLGKRGSQHILFNYVPHFGKHFETPPILSYLYSAPWQRVGNEPLFINE